MAANPRDAQFNELDPMGLTSHSRSQQQLAEDPNSNPNGVPAVGGPAQVGSSTPHLGATASNAALSQNLNQTQTTPQQQLQQQEQQYIAPPTTSERIAENFVLVVSLPLASAFWLMALISQAVVTAQRTLTLLLLSP